MIVPESDLISALRQMNPWWQGLPVEDLPSWRRAAFGEFSLWLKEPPAARAVLLAGARQIGKTTLFLQAITDLLEDDVKPGNIIYLTFDHPLLKLTGLEDILKFWRTIEPKQEGLEYLFVDEIQFLRNWQVWVKHQVDFNKERRIAITGSATQLLTGEQESGVGRWHTIRLATLSFYEFLKISGKPEPPVPDVANLSKLFSAQAQEFSRIAAQATDLTGHFHEYLLRGGFPQCANATSINWAQRLLREDIVDKVLKRDMTALFGVRNVVELEYLFIYLCLHGGGILDVPTICTALGQKKPTVLNFIELLSSVHLIHKLSPYGYGKEILRGRHKVYLADAAISPSVLSKGKALLEDESLLGIAVETAVFKHLFTRYYDDQITFSYWRGKRDREVDFVAESRGTLIPFEVKYRGQKTSLSDLKGMREFFEEKGAGRGYVITRDLMDFGPLAVDGGSSLLRIPAPLFCYWLGKSELRSVERYSDDYEAP